MNWGRDTFGVSYIGGGGGAFCGLMLGSYIYMHVSFLCTGWGAEAEPAAAAAAEGEWSQGTGW